MAQARQNGHWQIELVHDASVQVTLSMQVLLRELHQSNINPDEEDRPSWRRTKEKGYTVKFLSIYVRGTKHSQ